MKSFDLSGRAALVTGLTRGIGRGIADAIQGNGGDVLLHGHEPPVDLPADSVCFTADLRDPEAPRELMKNAFAHAPELDIWACNAGSFYDAFFRNDGRGMGENYKFECARAVLFESAIRQKPDRARAQRLRCHYRIDLRILCRRRLNRLRHGQRRARYDDAHAGFNLGAK